jgi:geranylgeranyl diphosphate synthase type I
MTTRTQAPPALAAGRDLVEPAMIAAVRRLCPDMRRVAGYHHGWWDEHETPTMASGGKALRPALAILSARAAGAAPERGVPAAIAAEFVHNFSLLHDDIMDGDAERRHRPTAWTVFGTSSAILAGDALLTAAIEALVDSGEPGALPAIRRTAAAVQRLIAGQSADLEFETRLDVSLADCIAMAGDKTAALLACACSVGAELVGGPPGLADRLADFGEHLGVAFQLVDDLLGIWGATEVTGKPVRADLRARKKSVPVVVALNAGQDASRELAGIYASEGTLAEADVERAARLVEQAGGRAFVEAEAQRRMRAAETSLAGLDIPDAVRAELLAIAHFVTARDN